MSGSTLDLGILNSLRCKAINASDDRAKGGVLAVPVSQIGSPFVWIAADGISSPPRLPACGLDPIEELSAQQPSESGLGN